MLRGVVHPSNGRLRKISLYLSTLLCNWLKMGLFFFVVLVDHGLKNYHLEISSMWFCSCISFWSGGRIVRIMGTKTRKQSYWRKITQFSPIFEIEYLFSLLILWTIWQNWERMFLSKTHMLQSSQGFLDWVVRRK